MSLGGFLKNLEITTITMVHQRFEPGTSGSDSQSFSTELRWGRYFKNEDNVFNTTGNLNEMGQRWCLADLLDIPLELTGTSWRYL